jgi:hypothetical protein
MVHFRVAVFASFECRASRIVYPRDPAVLPHIVQAVEFCTTDVRDSALTLHIGGPISRFFRGHPRRSRAET